MMRTLIVLLFCCLPFSSHAVTRTVSVHLFEWQWDDIANECENFLGPMGYAAIQVSPPQKSISGPQWWTRYQPLSYAIEGRSGNRAQFASMVQRCAAVGVDIYVDAVINHMSAGPRRYPEVPYDTWDFSDCNRDINNYQDAYEVQYCELLGLDDLRTGSDYVRQKIADFMNDLISMGVRGFRIDAAKHMPSGDIAAIKSRLTDQSVYIFQEVIRGPGEPIQPEQYTYIGDVTEFNFTDTMGHYFKGRAPLREISNIGSWGGWISSADALVFVANHDNQRQKTNDIITHKDGFALNNLAHVFMLGWPYGYPRVMSSYDWNDHDQGPPSAGASSCGNGWLCEHRERKIANMVAFRNNTSGAFRVTDYWDNGNSQMAWGRGGLGFVAINREGGSLNRTFRTGMAAGTYCDIIHADFNYDTGECTGATVTVDGSGNASLSVGSFDAVAFHVGAIVGTACTSCGGAPNSATPVTDRTGTGPGPGPGPGPGNGGRTDILFTCYQGQTYWGQSVYVVGNKDELGNWDPARAVKLEPIDYPTWNGNINLPDNTDVEWKCLKREENNHHNGVEWQPGSNNTFNTGSNKTPWAGF
ncbi:carbohydrate-binding module family 20 domain-containing protein [Marinibactrum halimedae]|uniref:Alpha-amylase n=1 Tax=Marinibactrum halimedae TaxID=1444977 RepID=A0AA37WM20_9GAMM|nr:carbohydrate-binding module family 20 domain-containing protein [Marinibactrum halimedae]MCD9461094.1 alpha amylase C-terminal domain-containing protein [Marinibactrum halimedae]GLS25745.1 alpha-amylase [Marinibactrum halimedae]